MAKVSAIKKNEKRKQLIKQKAPKRASLKKEANDINADPAKRFSAMVKLSEMSRNSSSVRYRNRCALSGRPRAFHGYFGLCRVMLRDMIAWGKIPGAKKSSW